MKVLYIIDWTKKPICAWRKGVQTVTAIRVPISTNTTLHLSGSFKGNGWCRTLAGALWATIYTHTVTAEQRPDHPVLPESKARVKKDNASERGGPALFDKA